VAEFRTTQAHARLSSGELNPLLSRSSPFPLRPPTPLPPRPDLLYYATTPSQGPSETDRSRVSQCKASSSFSKSTVWPARRPPPALAAGRGGCGLGCRRLLLTHLAVFREHPTNHLAKNILPALLDPALCVCVCVRARARAYVCVCVRACVRACARMCVCIHTCIYACMPHTHILFFGALFTPNLFTDSSGPSIG